MTKKPKIFENQIDKKINNNKEVFDSTKEVLDIINFKDDDNLEYGSENSIIDKITKLLNTNGYIFNIDVLIKTRSKEYQTHIASVINNHIITLDNDIINIDDVIDIEY